MQSNPIFTAGVGEHIQTKNAAKSSANQQTSDSVNPKHKIFDPKSKGTCYAALEEIEEAKMGATECGGAGPYSGRGMERQEEVQFEKG